MKTYGYLVAIETDDEILANVVYQAIVNTFDDDNHYKQYGKAKVDVEFLGEIDVYNETGVKIEEA